jgi:ABC-2 type transport system permease protein
MQPKHYIGFGFNHPMFLVLTLAIVISIAAGGIAGDVESGRAQLFYSRPIRRSRLVLARVATMAVAEVAALGVSLGAVAIGTRVAPDLRGTLAGAASVLVQYTGVAAVVGGAAFLASSLTRTRSAATGLAVAFTAGAYLLDFVSLLVDRARPLRWLTPFGYYDPLAAASHGVDAGRLAVLCVVAAVLVASACLVTERRDLV